ncbi:MAG: helix-turn-helix transcriptional regulator [Propionibacteriaceae bacterium]|jgi:DNA-binding CsgD family transcriptional regulator|nr:helix-turn-helix transcriptional regulator [Propionibacteriaceae bacterium]
MSGRISTLVGFGAFTYFFLTAELLFNECATAVIGSAASVTLYGIGGFATAAGYLLWPLTHHHSTAAHRRRILLAGAVAGAVCCVSLPFLTGTVPLQTGYFCGMLLAGLVGGACLNGIAEQVPLKRMGLSTAIPYAAAFALQAIVTALATLIPDPMAATVTQHVVIALALATAGWLTPVTEAARPKLVPKVTKKATNYLFAALVACLIVCCLYSLIDGIVMGLHANQQLEVQGWVRLIAIPGAIFAGWMADISGGRLFPFATLAAMVALVVSMYLFTSAETFSAALGCVYFFASFMTMYSIVTFTAKARFTRHPALWAVAGRAVKYAVGGVFSIISSALFASLGVRWLTISYVALVIVLLVVFFAADLLAADPGENQAGPAPDALSNREQEVLALLKSGLSTAEIAAQLFITKETVRVHIRNITQKTGATRESLRTTDQH